MLLSLIFLLGCCLCGCESAVVFEQTKPGGGWVTVTLANLSNKHGVLSSTSVRCDNAPSDCDTFASVTIGTFFKGNDILREARTKVWKDRNNLPFVFFNQTIAMNSSIKTPMYIHIVVLDEDLTESQVIGEFQHVVNLMEPESTTMDLYSTPGNRLVSLTVHVSVACYEFYHGPTCSEYCRDPPCGGSNSRTRCQDGAADANCLAQARERTSLAETGDQWSYWSGIAHWAVPAVCGVALVTVLVALGVRMVRTRSAKMIVAVQDTECPPLHPGDGAQPQQSPLSSRPADQARKFRNPVYSSLRSQQQYIRSSSTTTQSSVATDATDLASGQDDYEDLDAFSGNQNQQQQPPLPPGPSPSARRPLPQPGGL